MIDKNFNLIFQIICFWFILAARTSFTETGPFYIFDHFDTFFSMIETGENVSTQLLIRGIDLMFNTIDKLGQLLTTFLQKNQEAERNSYLNLVKMVLFLKVNLIKTIDDKMTKSDSIGVKKTNKKTFSGNDVNYEWDDKRYRSITQIYNVIQLPIEVLWNTSIPEENFVK